MQVRQSVAGERGRPRHGYRLTLSAMVKHTRVGGWGQRDDGGIRKRIEGRSRRSSRLLLGWSWMETGKTGHARFRGSGPMSKNLPDAPVAKWAYTRCRATDITGFPGRDCPPAHHASTSQAGAGGVRCTRWGAPTLASGRRSLPAHWRGRINRRPTPPGPNFLIDFDACRGGRRATRERERPARKSEAGDTHRNDGRTGSPQDGTAAHDDPQDALGALRQAQLALLQHCHPARQVRRLPPSLPPPRRMAADLDPAATGRHGTASRSRSSGPTTRCPRRTRTTRRAACTRTSSSTATAPSTGSAAACSPPTRCGAYWPWWAAEPQREERRKS